MHHQLTFPKTRDLGKPRKITLPSPLTTTASRLPLNLQSNFDGIIHLRVLIPHQAPSLSGVATQQ